MAGSSLLALIDDIATILDDVSVMTKVAAKKTSGVLGDDLALNAQQVTGVSPDRELPVVWKVAKGSAVNKLILVPAALLLSQFLPVLITPLLVLGGLFLCFEGFEKIFEKVFPHADAVPKEVLSEEEKVKGAVRTDFILSAEIIVITLGTAATKTLGQQAAVLVSISILMTVGVYGLVAGIVKIDDLGIWLNQKKSQIAQFFGKMLLLGAPLLMKTLGVVGTAAMFLVGGGLVNHSVPAIYQYQQQLSGIVSIGLDGLTGVISGGLIFLLVTLAKPLVTKLRKK
jgi:hypothetical protein